MDKLINSYLPFAIFLFSMTKLLQLGVTENRKKLLSFLVTRDICSS